MLLLDLAVVYSRRVCRSIAFAGQLFRKWPLAVVWYTPARFTEIAHYTDQQYWSQSIRFLSSTAVVLLAKSSSFGLHTSCQHSYGSNILLRWPSPGRVYWSSYTVLPSFVCKWTCDTLKWGDGLCVLAVYCTSELFKMWFISQRSWSAGVMWCGVCFGASISASC